MNVREILNRNPMLVGGVVVVIAAVALWFSVSKSFTSGSVPTARYFTTDDGATYFAGGLLDIPPFMKGDKEAVRAYVFECNGDTFVGYMERFNKEGRAAMEETVLAKKENRPPRNLGAIIAANQTGTEIKKPGEKEWVSGAPGPKTSALRTIKCKDGSDAMPKNE